MGLPHAPCRRVDSRMPLDLQSTAPLSRSISRSGLGCGLPDVPAAGIDALPRCLCARIEPCYHAREFRGPAPSICRRPARAAYGAAQPAVRCPGSSCVHSRHGPTLAAGIRRMVPARSAGIRRMSPPHPEGTAFNPLPGSHRSAARLRPVEEGRARGPISHVNQIKLAGRFSVRRLLEHHPPARW